MPQWVKDSLPLVLFVLISALVLFLFRDAALAFVETLESVAETRWAIPAVFAVFLIGSFLLVPQWALIAATIAAFGLGPGGGLSWAATLLALAVHLGLSRLLARPLAIRLDSDRFAPIRAFLGRNAFQSGLIVRLVPTGPAILVNMVAGVAGVRLWPFFLGSAVGIVPKILLTALVAQGLISGAQGRQVGLWIVIAALALIGLRVLASRGVKRAEKARHGEPSTVDRENP